MFVFACVLPLRGRNGGKTAALGGKLTRRLVENLGPGRHGDGAGLYLVVDPSGARRWVARVTVKGQKNRKGAPLRTDFGLGWADVVTLNQARKWALEYRRMANVVLAAHPSDAVELMANALS
ncbi:Arm DNA-binding domain-containing protein [Mameliella alba]|uniref:Arm DNA-binding domain-containing protein n=1 Tax=Mameliella alba TaxID=561184 RepID=UPI001E45F61B|nr:Arm DNA-binding domain-containing protein [Mameliella alba]